MANLTSGALATMVRDSPPDLGPVLQIINLKKIAANGNSDRYRLLVSDGEATYSHVMLATQLNTLMENNSIDAFCVVKVNRYLCNTIQQDKRILIILDLDVLKKGSEIGSKIGNPQQLKLDGSAPAAPAPAAAPVVKQEARAAPPPARQPLNPMSPQPTNRGAPNSGPGTPGSNRVHKIATLTPYQNRWRIRARVTQKSSIRTWSNSRGEGRLFSVNFLDESGEIRATGFNEAIDKFYEMLEVNKVFYVSRCTLKTANKQYSNVKNDYEMTFQNDTVIERCEEESDLPHMNFEFVPINEMEKHQAQALVDVIGVVKVCNEVSTVIGKASQKEITKRDMQIVDQSGVAINLTLWGSDAQTFEGNNHPVVAIKGAKLSDFGGRSLSVLGSSQLIVNPDTREAHMLRGWYDREGSSMEFGSYKSEGGGAGGGNTNWKTFEQVSQENLGQGDKADYFTAKATLMHLKKENCLYQACPTEQCNKKLVDQGNGMWRCEKCQKEFPNYKWRMILTATLADHTGNQWITSFQESAEMLLNCKADELGDMRENSEKEAAFDQVFSQALYKDYIFRLRSKVEIYNEESRLKTVCVQATPMDYISYSKHLLTELGNMGL